MQVRSEEIVRLQGIVIHYDEILTMSAQMAAATGDPKWASRYRQFEPPLDHVIKKLISLQPKAVKAAEQTDLANIALVEMENHALASVQKGNRSEAVKILFSKNYQKQKEFYAQGTAEFYKNIENALAEQWKEHDQKRGALKITLVIFITISFLGWNWIFLIVRRRNYSLKLLNESLDSQVKQRTAQLLQSSKMSALGEMAGGVAHEINTPLAIISMRVGQMESSVQTGDIDPLAFMEALEGIHKTVDRIARIVRGLKSFARESNTTPFQYTAISELIEETLSFCSERFNGLGIKLEVVKSPGYELARIECRPIEISQVLLNLLNNSCDAIEKFEQKWICIEVVEQEQCVEISVIDSGCGIPRDLQDKIMQPFFTTKEVGKGTGLGLSISNGILLAHQGRIYVDNTCRNTKITIVVPKIQSKTRETFKRTG